MLHNWFTDVPKSAVNQLVIRQFKTNETFIRKNQLSDRILIILDGICNVINQTDNGAEIITLRLAKGDLIGVSEQVLHSMRYIASIKSCTPLIATELDTETFNNWLHHYPKFIDFVIKNLVTRLHYTADFSANCQSSTSKVNLAKYLIDRYNFEVSASACPENAAVTIHETHEMISHFLGIHTRTLERHIYAFKQEGLISTDKGKVSISPAQYQALIQYAASNL